MGGANRELRVETEPEVAMNRARQSSLALSLIISAACGKKFDGPTPTVTGVSPPAVCQAQIETVVQVSGAGLAPPITGALADKRVELPAVALTLSKDLLNMPASAAPLVIPDDPNQPTQSHLRWSSQSALSFDVYPGLMVPPGLYDVGVTNATGKSAKFAGSLLAVPPPTLSKVGPDLLCGDKANSFEITGDFFIQSATAKPTIVARASSGESKTLEPASIDDCRDLPGSAGFRACTKMTVSLPADGLASAVHTLTVQNPTPVGCASVEPVVLTLVPEPAITKIEPTLVCTSAGTSSVTITGTGFLTVSGMLPQVKIGNQTYTPTASGCTSLTGPSQATQTCTSLTVTAAAASFPVGSHAVMVTNPDPAGCQSSQSIVFEVTGPPVLTAVQPSAVCSGSSTLTLSGSSFAANAQVTLGTTAASRVTVTGDTTAVAQFPAGLPVGGPYPVTISNGSGCDATLLAKVTVISGPQLFFVDPAVVYSGISTQATAYGTGFTGAVQGVSVRPAAGGALIPLSFRQDPARPSQVQITLPKGLAAGEYDVEVTDTSACAAILAKAVNVSDQKTLALAAPAVSPPFGWAQQSTATTISADSAGGGFAAVPRVYLNPTNPGAATVATALGAVTFVDRTQLTALVSGLPIGKYDVIVVNPDGKVGVATEAFEVTQDSPPTIGSLSPGSVSNRNPETFTIRGTDFRQPAVSLRCLDGTSSPLASSPAATITGSSATSIDVRFDASLAGVACIVRVANGDNMTFAEFSALVITNPAQNLYAAKSGPDLTVGRRAPVALTGNASSSARYMHVIGGDDGAGNALASVESSALGLLGTPAPFFIQRNRMATARTLAGGAQIGRFLYVVGGQSGGSALTTVERAAVLDPKVRGEIIDLLLDPRDGQGLGTGTWYYRVAAVMGGSDPFNPGGEGLASDPFPVRLPDLGAARKFRVTVKWRVVPGATRYRVYRSPSAGATVGTEQVIGEVAAPTIELEDSGAAAISSGNPLPVGSLGVFTTLPATLSVVREGAGVAAAADPNDASRYYLYAICGRQNATTALASHEFLAITIAADGSQTPAGAFTAGTRSLGSARWQLGATPATRDVSTRIPAGSTYIYALSGLAANGMTMVPDADAALVETGGQLGTWTSLRTMNRAGYAAITAGDFVFAFGGGNAAPDLSIISGEICGPGVGGCGPIANQVPPNIANWNAGQTMLAARYLTGGLLSGAFIYVVGGVTVAGSPATVTRATEFRLW
jgi:hypothetical protein